MLNEELVKKIAASKKYKGVYLKTIARIVEDCARKYQEKQIEKKAKNLLHQVWGAYFSTPLNFKKLFEKFEQTTKIVGGPTSHNLKKAVLPLLQIQSSIEERIPILDDFYKEIFKITGKPKTIVDLGSGLNPLTFLWMDLAKDAQYFAFDIDKNQAEFLKSVFKNLNINQVKINLGDILIDEFPETDIAFFLKVLPPLERQLKGSSLKALQKQNSKFLVVSFPTKSISGKQKGMVDFYTKWFQDLIKDQQWKTEKILFKSELVFIIARSDISSIPLIIKKYD